MELEVLVHQGTLGIFLLGNDAFYNRLIYDQGKQLAFPNNEFPPIPIKYELTRKLVKLIHQSQVAPRSSALVQVKVTDKTQLTGREVLLTPLTENNNETPVRNTVSINVSCIILPICVSQNNVNIIVLISSKPNWALY